MISDLCGILLSVSMLEEDEEEEEGGCWRAEKRFSVLVRLES